MARAKTQAVAVSAELLHTCAVTALHPTTLAEVDGLLGMPPEVRAEDLTEAVGRLVAHRQQVLILIALLYARAKRLFPRDREWLTWAMQWGEYRPRYCYELAAVGAWFEEHFERWPVLLACPVSALRVLVPLPRPALTLFMDLHGRDLAGMTVVQVQEQARLCCKEEAAPAPAKPRLTALDRLQRYRPEKLAQTEELMHLVVRGERLLAAYRAAQAWNLTGDELAVLRETAETILAVTANADGVRV